MMFSNDQLHIILKRRNLEMGVSKFFQLLEKNIFNGTFQNRFFFTDISWRSLNALIVYKDAPI